MAFKSPNYISLATTMTTNSTTIPINNKIGLLTPPFDTYSPPLPLDLTLPIAPSLPFSQPPKWTPLDREILSDINMLIRGINEQLSCSAKFIMIDNMELLGDVKTLDELRDDQVVKKIVDKFEMAYDRKLQTIENEIKQWPEKFTAGIVDLIHMKSRRSLGQSINQMDSRHTEESPHPIDKFALMISFSGSVVQLERFLSHANTLSRLLKQNCFKGNIIMTKNELPRTSTMIETNQPPRTDQLPLILNSNEIITQMKIQLDKVCNENKALRDDLKSLSKICVREKRKRIEEQRKNINLNLRLESIANDLKICMGNENKANTPGESVDQTCNEQSLASRRSELRKRIAEDSGDLILLGRHNEKKKKAQPQKVQSNIRVISDEISSANQENEEINEQSVTTHLSVNGSESHSNDHEIESVGNEDGTPFQFMPLSIETVNSQIKREMKQEFGEKNYLDDSDYIDIDVQTTSPSSSTHSEHSNVIIKQEPTW